MQAKITTLHPQGKQGVNINAEKYTRIKEAILQILETGGEIPFIDLAPAVGKRLARFDGSIGWYTTTVKLDLEARGVIERISGSSPQRIRMVAGR